MSLFLGAISAILITGAGFASLSGLGLARGSVGLGLAPAVGLALIAVLATWGLQLGVPQSITALLLLAICLVGFAVAPREWVFRREARKCFPRAAAAMLLSAVLIPLAVLPQAVSIQAGVPDYIHDGAHHAETVEALRHGARLAGFDWYPTGFHAPAAALLSLVPTIDSASGAVGWAVGLTLVAPLAVFGFGAALWGDLRIGAAGAVLLALSSTYPYEPHLYSVWPMAAGLLLMVGLWTVALEYLSNPTVRLAVPGGLLAAALLLTHGTEIYTALIGLVAFAALRWKVVASGRVLGHVGLAAMAALLFAAPYLPQLGAWANTGGTVSVGTDYYSARHGEYALNDPVQELLFWSGAVSSGLLVDLPLRLGLLAVGGWIAFRQRTGRVVVGLTVAFIGLVAIFRYVDVPSLRTLFALTLPWGVDGRLLMTVPILAAPLTGAGVIGIANALASRARQSSPTGTVDGTRWLRIARRFLVLGNALGLASVVLVAAKFSLQTSGVVTYAASDAAAMAWLRQNAKPGDVLMNDGAADAGIWAPYKGNVSIVLPRTRAVSPDGPELLVRANVGRLDSRADARDAACKLGIDYVFRGEGQSPSEFRQFPPLEELRTSSALDEVFHSGDAAIFRTHLNCAS